MAFIEQRTLYEFNPIVWRYTSTENLDFIPNTYPIVTEIEEYASVSLILASAMPRAQAGLIEKCHFDYLYNKIHFYPNILRVGSLLAERVDELSIWNAYSLPRQLVSIEEVNTEGITINASPTIFSALEEKIYSINTTFDGPATIDATYIFNFDIYSIEFRILGRRIVVFRWRPQQKFTEKLEWLTDIIQTFRREQRISVRQIPRQKLKYTFVKDDTVYAELHPLLAMWSYRAWAVPIWSEAVRVSDIPAGSVGINFDTTTSEYTEYAFIYENDNKNQALTINNVRTDGIDIDQGVSEAYDDAYIMPLKTGYLPNGLAISRGTAYRYSTFDAEFTIVNTTDISLTNLPQYGGVDVFLDGAYIVGNLSENITMPAQIIDNGQGDIKIEPTQDYIRNKKTLGKVTSGKANIFNFKRWLYSRYGRQKTFWLPDTSHDIQPINDIFGGAISVEIKNINLNTYGTMPIPTIMVLKNGTIFYRKIVNAVVSLSGEVITLDIQFDVDIRRSDIKYWSIMYLVRLDTDSIQLEYDNNALFANIPVVEVPA